MRQPINTKTLHLCVSPKLADDAKARATADGMTLSELVRDALRRELQSAA